MKEAPETITLPGGATEALIHVLKMSAGLLGSVDLEGEDSAKRDHLQSLATSLRLEIEVQR